MTTLALIIIVGLGAYFTPTVAALIRKPANLGSIIVINIFAGWTVLGWVAALAMAFKDVDKVRSIPPARSRS